MVTKRFDPKGPTGKPCCRQIDLISRRSYLPMYWIIPFTIGSVGLFSHAFGQLPATLDTSLHFGYGSAAFLYQKPGAGAYDGAILDGVVQSSGRTVIGGSFHSFHNSGHNYLCRLESNGSIDPSFAIGSGPDSDIRLVRLATNDKIYVAGLMSFFDGLPCKTLARLHPDGLLDQTFQGDPNLAGAVNAMKVMQDDRLYIGGSFNAWKGLPAPHLALLTSEGDLDESFVPDSGLVSTVSAIAVQQDGKLLLGGTFHPADSTVTRHLIRLLPSGEQDPTFVLDQNPNAEVRRIILSENGLITVFGDFTSVNNTDRRYIARFMPNGELDTSFYNQIWWLGVPTGAAERPDGRIVVTGIGYDNWQGQSFFRQLLPDGSQDTTFHVGSGFDQTTRGVILIQDGKALVHGGHGSYNGRNSRSITCVLPTGKLDPSYNWACGINGYLTTILPQDDDRSLLGGSNIYFNSTNTFGLVRVNFDGTVDTSFAAPGGENDIVEDMASSNSGGTWVCGTLTSFIAGAEMQVAHVNGDGSVDPIFGNGLTFNGPVKAIADRAGGGCYVGGVFTSISGGSHGGIAGLLTDGTLAPNFSSGIGFNGEVMDITTLADGRLAVCGDFSEYNGAFVGSVVLLSPDGVLDGTFQSSLSGAILNIIPLPTGELCLRSASHSIHRIGLNGASELIHTFNGGQDELNAIAAQGDGKVIIGGRFESYNGFSARNLLRLQLTDEADEGFFPHFSYGSSVRHMQIPRNDQILVTGNFRDYDGHYSPTICRLNLGPVQEIGLPERTSSVDDAFTSSPNPSDGHINLVFSGSSEGDRRIRIRHVGGQVVMDRSISGNDVQVKIDLSTLNAGIYLLQITSESRGRTVKLIVQ